MRVKATDSECETAIIEFTDVDIMRLIGVLNLSTPDPIIDDIRKKFEAVHELLS